MFDHFENKKNQMLFFPLFVFTFTASAKYYEYHFQNASFRKAD